MIIIIDDDDDDDAQVTGLVERMTSQAWATERAQLVNDNLTSNEVAPLMILQRSKLEGKLEDQTKD